MDARPPSSRVGYTTQAFELVPQNLTRKIALAQTVDMVRVTMEYFEKSFRWWRATPSSSTR